METQALLLCWMLLLRHAVEHQGKKNASTLVTASSIRAQGYE